MKISDEGEVMNDRQRRLEYLRNTFEATKLQAMLAYAEATTGACTRKNRAQGREVTEEERAAGQTIGWRPLTDQENITEELETMQRHIHFMRDLNDEIAELLK